MIALAVTLSFFPIYEVLMGGSVTFAAMLPIIILAYRHGAKWGFGAAFVFSVLQLLLGLKSLSYGTTALAVISIIFIDYILAYTLLGAAAFARNVIKGTGKKAAVANISLATLLVCALRFLCHWLVGGVVWYGLTKNVWYADDTAHIVHKYGPYVYSFVYNISYMLPELIITLAVAIFISLIINFKRENLRY